MNEKLTPKQRRFVEAYAASGNATQAAIEAGYSARNAGKIGPRLVGKSGIAEAIKALSEQESGRNIASAEERQEFWSKVMRGKVDGADLSHRLKASELLGKAQGDFLNRHELNGAGLTPVLNVVIDRPMTDEEWAAKYGGDGA